jgi:hypothetical protein
MQNEQLVETIFEENYAKAQGSLLRELLVEASFEDYKKNVDSIKKLERN